MKKIKRKESTITLANILVSYKIFQQKQEKNQMKHFLFVCFFRYKYNFQDGTLGSEMIISISFLFHKMICSIVKENK